MPIFFIALKYRNKSYFYFLNKIYYMNTYIFVTIKTLISIYKMKKDIIYGGFETLLNTRSKYGIGISGIKWARNDFV